MPPGTLLAPAAGSRARFLSLLLVLSTFAAPSARAHSITIDGDPAGWDCGTWPAQSNLGCVARGPMGEGEFIWRDAAGDERTVFILA
jgi:hypothetical protein